MPETRQPADDWALLLEQAFRDHDAARQGHDLRPYFRAQAFREHHNESEIRLRAHAFRQTLVRLPLTVRRGDCFIGSPASFYVDPLPRDISEADLRLARDVCGWHAPREHGVGFDAVLPDYPTLLALGLGGMGHRLADAVRHLDPDTAANDVAEAMQTVLTGLGAFAHRCADTCREVGREEDARLLAHIAELPPRSMREALQLVWLVHLALLAEGRTAPALGRMDRWLEPFYLRDMERGDLDREAALDLLCHFFVRFAEAPPGAWITLGGPRPAGEAAPGETATLLLDALALAPAPGLRVAVRMAAAAPETLLRPILELLEVDGPAITLVNDDVLAAELTQAGLGAEAAEDYAVLDAIAPAVPGRHPVWAAHRLDLRNPIGAGIAAWRDDAARSWASLREQLETTLRTAVDGEAKRLRKRFAPAAARTHRDPVHAALLADCVDRLCDANAEEAPLLRLVGVSAPDLLPVADAVATLAAQVCEGGATQPETLLDTAADGFG
ncbi:MAG: pyruvate formate lyase family protein, partial [Planctomycetota bacterium]